MNLFKKAACIVAALCMVQAAFSIPADPHPRKVRQADGTEITICVRGNEHGHIVFTADGHPLQYNEATANYEYATITNGKLSCSGIVAADADKRTAKVIEFLKSSGTATQQFLNSEVQRLKKETAESSSRRGVNRLLMKNFPTTGSPRSLVLLIEFSDVAFTSIDNPKDFYTRMLNEEGFTHSNGAEGSARDFYKASSMGLFTPQFDVVGPIKLSQPRKYYGGDSPQQDYNVAEVITEACLLVDSEVDFSQYDTDGDGLVDNIYYFYAGSGQADNTVLKEAIWPHSSNLVTPLTLDGVQVKSYACSNELRCATDGTLSTAGIGTFVHEFGHVLGLIDHYDSFYSGFVFHPGSWDTMATGSYNNNGNTPPLFTAFERSELGWLALTELEVGIDSVSRLPELTTSNFAYRISVPGKPSEYFVLENRQQQGWDRFLPGHGMLLWHIDVDTAEWAGNSANAIGSHQLIDIVEADKILSENTRNADVFPGEANIKTWNVEAWNGSTLMTFDEIDETDGMIKFVQKGTAYKMPQPTDITVSNIEDSCFTLTWPAVSDATYYILSISKINADGTKTAIDGFDCKRLLKPGVITVTDLTPLTDYEVSICAGIGSYLSEPLSKTIQTTEIPFRKLSPANVQISDVTHQSFRATWQSIDGADGYLLSLCKHTYTATDKGYDFTDKAEGMPSQWTSSTTTYSSVSGYYGVAAPSLRMSADGDYLQMSFPESMIDKLTFWYRSRYETGQLIIEKQLKGEWSEAGRLSPSTSGTTASVELGGADAVRIVYSRESGYVAIDDVVLHCQTITRIPVEQFANKKTNSATTYIFSGLEPSATYGLNISATRGDQTSLASSESIVTMLSESAGIKDNYEEIKNNDNAIYDLHGRRIANPKRGIYIRNGKKVIY
ncbi:MAG: M6 family metalloprotease domain-containing protein [Prevotella sp.]|nr:M6 family metalloprotease domain-containing protein [Prevotella sp.]